MLKKIRVQNTNIPIMGKAVKKRSVRKTCQYIFLAVTGCVLLCRIPVLAEDLTGTDRIRIPFEESVSDNNQGAEETVSKETETIQRAEEEEEDPAVDGTYEKAYQPGQYIIRPMLQAMKLMRAARMSGSVKPAEGTYRDFYYVHAAEQYTAPADGIYKIEAWGAQGGGERNMEGGLGGYAAGYLKMMKNETVYVCVGSAGYDENGGYNGGGSGLHGRWDGGWRNTGAGGGGCTSVTRTGRGVLANFDGYRQEVLLTAGGGGGDHHSEAAAFFGHEKNRSEGTDAGGLQTDGFTAIRRYSKDGEDDRIYSAAVKAVGQTYGYRFGAGESNGKDSGAGGGGWFGGYAADLGSHVLSGGGGSSYTGGIPDVQYGSALYQAETVSAVNRENGRARITLYKLLLKAEMREQTAEVIEKQTAEMTADVYGTEKYVWEYQKTTSGESPSENGWGELDTGDSRYRTDASLNGGTGEISLQIAAEMADHNTWYRLKVLYDSMEKCSDPCRLTVIPLKMAYLECKTELTAEAGELIPRDLFQVTAVYNNSEIRKNIWEDSALQRKLFMKRDGEWAENLRIRTTGDKIPVTLHLEHPDQPADVMVNVRIKDTVPPVITKVTAENFRYYPEDREQKIDIHITAQDESDGPLLYWITSKNAEICTDPQPNPVISVSFQHNEVIIIHVRDEMGNESVREFEVCYVDRDAPDPVSVEADPAEWTAGTVKVTVRAEDRLSGLDTKPYSFDGGKTWQKDTSLDVSDNCVLDIRVRDAVGNMSDKEWEVSNIDKMPPVICQVSSRPESNWTEGSAAVIVSAEDAGCGLAEEAYSFDAGQTWQKSPEIMLEESAVLHIRVRDQLGQTAGADYEIKKISRAREIVLDMIREPQNVLVEIDRQPRPLHEENRDTKPLARIRQIFLKELQTENLSFADTAVYQKEDGSQKIFSQNPAVHEVVIHKKDVNPSGQTFAIGAAAAGGTAGLAGFGFFLIFGCCEIYRINTEEGTEEYFGRKILRRRNGGFLIRYGRKPDKMNGKLFRIHFSAFFLRRHAGRKLTVSFQEREYEMIIGRSNTGCDHILKI